MASKKSKIASIFDGLTGSLFKKAKTDTIIAETKDVLTEDHITDAFRYMMNNAGKPDQILIPPNYRFPFDYHKLVAGQWVLTPDNKIGIVDKTVNYPSNNVMVSIVEPVEMPARYSQYYANDLIKVPKGAKLKTALTLYGKSVKKDKWTIKK